MTQTDWSYAAREMQLMKELWEKRKVNSVTYGTGAILASRYVDFALNGHTNMPPNHVKFYESPSLKGNKFHLKYSEVELEVVLKHNRRVSSTSRQNYLSSPKKYFDTDHICV